MKRTLALLVLALATVTAASAQQNVNFADLPLVSTPTLLPNGYGSLNWSNIFYVDPSQWSGAGLGYKDGPIGGILRPQDVAFIGSKACRQLQEACYGTISALGAGGIQPISFQPVSAVVAAGYGPTYMTVIAYKNGNYVGSLSFPLGTQLRTINFPASWTSVTQLVFQTDAGGDLVFYDLQFYLLGG